MLDEKTMVSDALAGVNGELVRYGEMISQTENKELKQKLKQIRIERTQYRELATGNFSCILWYLKCTPGHFFCSGMQHFVAFLFIRLLYYTFLTASDII